MDDALELLRAEFGAEPGTFLLLLHVDLVWDTTAFARLERAMTAVCQALADAEELPRWLVAGFWYTCDFVPREIGHPGFHPTQPAAYYQRSCRRLAELNAWFTCGYPI